MSGLATAIAALDAVLAAETAALDAGDLRGAAAGSTTKADAIAAFLAAQVADASSIAPPSRPQLAAALQRLREATLANRAALERSLAVQGRVIEAIARAAMRAGPVSAAGYARPVRGAACSLAVSVRA